MIFDLVYESRDGVRVHLTIAIHQHADLVARCHGIHHAGLHRSTVAEIVWQPKTLAPARSASAAVVSAEPSSTTSRAVLGYSERTSPMTALIFSASL